MNMDVFEKIIIPLITSLIGAAIGSFLAFDSQKKLILRSDKKVVLSQLMGCRHDAQLDNDFVKALNMTALIFHNNIAVKDALHHYLTITGRENLNYSNGQRLDAFFN